VANKKDNRPSAEFFGEKLLLHPQGASPFAFMEFGEAATAGADADSFSGIGAQLRLIDSGLADDEQVTKFRQLARTNRAQSGDLLPLVKAVVQAMSERPTSQPSDSSDGQPSIEPKSDLSSDDKILELVGGRVDKLAMVKQGQQAKQRKAAS
jgi:hypothetical protein